MFTDARTLETGTSLEVNLCVVGAGAAGLSVVSGLVDGAHRIAVIESGAMSPNRRIDDLSKGKAFGRLLGQRNQYLQQTRTRAFGGLGEQWHGTCRPLDAEDFAARGWVPNSGWPIDPSELAEPYRRAGELLGLGQVSTAASEEWIPNDEGFRSSWLDHAPRPSIAELFSTRLRKAENVEVLTRANVSAIELDDAKQRVVAVHVDCLDGPQLIIRARAFVLAAGVIENARLLLLSDHQRSRGLGNEHDTVGRFFMDQIQAQAGYVALLGRDGRMSSYGSALPRPGADHPMRAILRPTEALQAHHELLNSQTLVSPVEVDAAGELGHDVVRLAEVSAALGTTSGSPNAEPWFGEVVLRGEQSPNRASRVRLGSETDELNLRRARLTWQLSDHDVWSLTSTARLLGDSLGRRRLGRMRLQAMRFWSRRHYSWTGYQSGTTRMSMAPADGVVDTDCRLHDIDNLFVAGSSVFPTSGCSGPMLTTVALALRLGDHVNGILDRESA